MNSKPSREQIREHVAGHPDATIATVARTLGVHRATVYRALGATSATPKSATSATTELGRIPEGWALAGVNVAALQQLQEPAGQLLADGWYQVEGGKPYRVNGQAVTDLAALEFDAEGNAVVRAGGVKYTVTRREARPARSRRSVQQRVG